MAVRCMIIVRRHMLIHVDTWWYMMVLFIHKIYLFCCVAILWENILLVGFFYILILCYTCWHYHAIWWRQFVMIHQADQRLNYLILHVIFFSNIVTYYIQIYIPTFTPGLQSARETLMVESAQSWRVADIVCLTPGRPHSVTKKSHSNQFLKTCLLHCLHVLLYIHTLLERSKENGHYWSWIFSNSIQLLAHMCMR